MAACSSAPDAKDPAAYKPIKKVYAAKILDTLKAQNVVYCKTDFFYEVPGDNVSVKAVMEVWPQEDIIDIKSYKENVEDYKTRSVYMPDKCLLHYISAYDQMFEKKGLKTENKKPLAAVMIEYLDYPEYYLKYLTFEGASVYNVRDCMRVHEFHPLSKTQGGINSKSDFLLGSSRHIQLAELISMNEEGHVQKEIQIGDSKITVTKNGVLVESFHVDGVNYTTDVKTKFVKSKDSAEYVPPPMVEAEKNLVIGGSSMQAGKTTFIPANKAKEACKQ